MVTKKVKDQGSLKGQFNPKSKTCFFLSYLLHTAMFLSQKNYLVIQDSPQCFVLSHFMQKLQSYHVNAQRETCIYSWLKG